jgi:hypothetical protein
MIIHWSWSDCGCVHRDLLPLKILFILHFPTSMIHLFCLVHNINMDLLMHIIIQKKVRLMHTFYGIFFLNNKLISLITMFLVQSGIDSKTQRLAHKIVALTNL